MSAITYAISCSATSAIITNTATVTAGAGPHALGGLNNAHGFLRFDTTSIVDADLIKISKLSIKVSSIGVGTVPGIDVWASEFGAAIDAGDYNLAASNVSPIRAKIYQILAPAHIAGATGTVGIPSRFINAAGNSDFELRTQTTTTIAGDSTIIYGSGGTGQIVLTIDSDGIPTYVSGQIPTLNIQTLAPADGIDENAYDYIATGEGSYVAFDLETTRGYPVKGKYLMDFNTTDLDTEAVNIYSTALRRERQMPGKVVVGREGAGGSVAFEYTPERIWKLLLGWMKVSGTTGANPYTTTLIPAQSKEVKTFTVVKKYGNNQRNVYRGMVGSTLSLSARLDEIVSGSVSFMGRQEWIYTDPDSYGTAGADEYVLSSTAAYDTNPGLSFIGVEVDINSVANNGTIPNFDISLNNGAQEIRGLRRRRDITGHSVQGLSVDLSFSMYFRDDAQLKAFLSQATKNASPYKASTTLEFQRIDLKLGGPLGETTQEVVFTITKFLATAVRKPISGTGAVMLSISGSATIDSSLGRTLTVTVMNSETAASWNASTDTITIMPAGQILP